MTGRLVNGEISFSDSPSERQRETERVEGKKMNRHSSLSTSGRSEEAWASLLAAALSGAIFFLLLSPRAAACHRTNDSARPRTAIRGMEARGFGRENKLGGRRCSSSLASRLCLIASPLAPPRRTCLPLQLYQINERLMLVGMSTGAAAEWSNRGPSRRRKEST